jgi:hypothetical protein
MINNYQDYVDYLGNGTLATYSFPYKISNLNQILIQVFDIPTNALVFSQLADISNANVTSATFDAVSGGGTITLPANLAANKKLILKLSMESNAQAYQFREQDDFKLRHIENALDALTTYVARLYEKSKRTLTFDDKASYQEPLNNQITTLPVPYGIPIMNATGDALEMKTPTDIVALGGGGGGGSGLPVGGLAGDIIEKDALNVAGWKNYSFSGFSSRFGSIFTSTSLQDTLNKIIAITYTAPSVVFNAAGSGTIREKGALVGSSLLTATVTKTSDPIAAVRFYQGATLLSTATGTIPAGGVETFNYATAFSNNITFSSQVDDNGATGGPTTVTNSQSFNFVYPYYSDAGAVGLSAAQVGLLTKTVIVSTATVTKTMVATAGQVFYFAYPAAYPSLFSILDVNGFEVIADWTLTTANITGLDATAQSYKIYSFNNPVTAGSYQYTFKR